MWTRPHTKQKQGSSPRFLGLHAPWRPPAMAFHFPVGFFFFFLVMLHGSWDSSSPTKNGTQGPCSGNTESQLRDHQGSPSLHFHNLLSPTSYSQDSGYHLTSWGVSNFSKCLVSVKQGKTTLKSLGLTSPAEDSSCNDVLYLVSTLTSSKTNITSSSLQMTTSNNTHWASYW